MGNKRKATANFFAGISFALVSLIPKRIKPEFEQVYKRTGDVNYDLGAAVLNTVFWVLVITAGYFLLMSILYCFGDDKKQQEESSEATETAMREKGKMQCRFCGHWIAENAAKCMRCGTIVTKQVPRPKVITSIAQWEAENAPKKSCVFCGKTMRADETFCGTCGRRQD